MNLWLLRRKLWVSRYDVMREYVVRATSEAQARSLVLCEMDDEFAESEKKEQEWDRDQPEQEWDRDQPDRDERSKERVGRHLRERKVWESAEGSDGSTCTLLLPAGKAGILVRHFHPG